MYDITRFLKKYCTLIYTLINISLFTEYDINACQPTLSGYCVLAGDLFMLKKKCCCLDTVTHAYRNTHLIMFWRTERRLVSKNLIGWSWLWAHVKRLLLLLEFSFWILYPSLERTQLNTNSHPLILLQHHCIWLWKQKWISQKILDQAWWLKLSQSMLWH